MPKRMLSPNAEKSKVKQQKYLSKFNNVWKVEFQWVQKSDKGSDHAYCTMCRSDILISYGGKNDISRHANTLGHKANLSSVNGTKQIGTFFKKDESVDKVTYAETLFANFVSEHNLPFSVADHFSELVKVMFPDSAIAKKFSCKRTKTAHIVNETLAPHWDSKVTELCQKQKFSVMIDESSDQGDDKLLAVLVRVYDHNVMKISTRFLGIPACNIGTGALIFNTLNQIFIDRDIPWANCIGFSSDNCSVMTGKHNSVLSRVRSMNPEVYDVGCVCHLANLCAQKAVKTLPLPVDDLLIDIYYHFHHSSKRKEQLKEFQAFTDVEPMKLLKHCSTRWLSLERCVKRLLQQWPALKSYFQSHDECDKPGRINRCFEGLSSEEMWLYFAFLEFVLPILNDFNTTFQAGESMIGHLHAEMVRLLRKLLGRFVQTKIITLERDITKVKYQIREHQHDDTLIAVGWRAREYIGENEEIAPEIVSKFFRSVRQFYSKVVETVIAKFPFHDEVLKAMAYLNPETKENVHPDAVLTLSQKFLTPSPDEKAQLEDEAQEYIVTPKEELPSTSPEDPLEEFWRKMALKKIPATGKAQFGQLCALSKVLLSLPHSNADTERSFSMLRKIQTDARASLCQRSVQSLLSVKLNNDCECHKYQPSVALISEAKKSCSKYLERLQV